MSFVKRMDRTYDALRRFVRNEIVTYSSRKLVKAHQEKLTKEQVSQIKEFYAPYKKVSTVFHKYYAKRTGNFYVNYIPHDLYLKYIDRYYNDGKKAVVLENKCYFAKMFTGVLQPEVVCYRLNDFWYDASGKVKTFEEVKRLIALEQDIVVKQAIGSSGGHSVWFMENGDVALENQFEERVKGINRDIIVQRRVKQHADLAKLNESSLNSLRVVSLLRKNGVKVYSTVLRMGINGMKVDNESSGGVNCGVTPDGLMRKIGYTKKSITYTVHPSSGIQFEGYKIPAYEKIIEKVKQLHVQIPHFRLVSWDFAVNEAGEPVLIEANLNTGGIHINQINNGPLFGDDTKEILDEVFGKSDCI